MAEDEREVRYHARIRDLPASANLVDPPLRTLGYSATECRNCSRAAVLISSYGSMIRVPQWVVEHVAAAVERLRVG